MTNGQKIVGVLVRITPYNGKEFEEYMKSIVKMDKMTFPTLGKSFVSREIFLTMKYLDLEICSEQVMNLLSKTGPLQIRENAKRVILSGLSLTPMYSVKELLELLTLGNSSRTQQTTDISAAIQAPGKLLKSAPTTWCTIDQKIMDYIDHVNIYV
uniref:Kinesin motor domain-containing protein n=1 Tax=Glossina pallidipes TaxID=7398 RepID=A0A1A9Z0N3_GLOPL